MNVSDSFVKAYILAPELKSSIERGGEDPATHLRMDEDNAITHSS